MFHVGVIETPAQHASLFISHKNLNERPLLIPTAYTHPTLLRPISVLMPVMPLLVTATYRLIKGDTVVV